MSEVTRLALLGPDERTSTLHYACERISAVRVDSETFQGVIVCSFDAACSMAEQGKHVFLAGPCTESEEQAAKLVELCRSRGVTLFVGDLPRNTPACAPMLGRLAEGKLGAPGLLRVHRWRQEKPKAMSDLLGDIDLSLHVFGNAPTEVFATQRDGAGRVQVRLGFPDGGMALIDYATLPSGRGYDSVCLVGATGAAYADDHHNSHLLFTGGDPQAWISDSGNGLTKEVEMFVDCMEGNAVPPLGCEDILRVHRVLGAVQEALETGGVMRQRGETYEQV